MNKIRYLTMLLMCLIGCITAFGQDDFNPTSPIEPGAPQIKHTLTLVAVPNEGGSVSGGGSILDGTERNLSASANSSYQFVAWTDKDGMVLSTARSFSYTTKSEHETLYAHFKFVPSSPGEPAEPNTTLYYKLTLEGSQGCTVSGGGRYLYGKSVYVSASVESGYNFVNWTNEAGEVVSTSSSFYYTKKDDNETLTATCVFDPSSPGSPGDPVLKHWVKATSTDGGTISGSTNSRILEGDSYSLYAYVNTGYRFLGWYKDGELYTALTSFSAKMGKDNVNYEARFVFDPASPSEPAKPAIGTYSYFLMTVNGTPGSTVEYPIYLSNKETVNDVNIRLTFPAGLIVEPTDFVLADDATGYSVSIAEAHDDISIIEEGAQLYDFTLIGGQTSAGTHALLTFKITIPEGFTTGGNHQVKINQVSMALPDGTPVTARTRNGRIGVYEWGDSNGDGTVTVADLVTAIAHMQGKTPENFIEEVTDINEDGTIDPDDCTDIETIVLNK